MESGSDRLTVPLRVAIAGSGNVASHLAEALAHTSACTLEAVASRNPDHAVLLAARTNSRACAYSELAALNPDIIIVSVADRAMTEVVGQIGRMADTVLALHTSGTLDKSCLEPISSRTGIFYPFQTFTKGFDVNMAEVPFFIETAYEDDFAIAKTLAESISPHVYVSDEERRRHLHIAGVFTSNFVNVLLGAVEEELKASDYPAEVAVPLLRQTIEKAAAIGSFAAQTGPAVRGDIEVMMRQLAAVDPKYRETYKVLSDLIMKIHNPTDEQNKL